jgi:uncharacterized membrane protein
VTTNRLEAFSDGVLAVAITLLIFNVQLPHVADGEVGAALLALWPAYASYVVSFFTIGIIWVNHHALFDLIERVDRPLLFINLFLLMVVAFLPFPTSVLSEYIRGPNGSRIAAIVYCSTMLLMGIGFGALWVYATRRPHLLVSHLDPEFARAAVPGFTIGSAGYIVAIVVATFSAPLSLAICAAVAVYYIFNRLPGSKQGRGYDEPRAESTVD